MAPHPVPVLLAVEAPAERLDAPASPRHPGGRRVPLLGDPGVELRREVSVEVIVGPRPGASRLTRRLLEEDGRAHQIAERVPGAGRVCRPRRVEPGEVITDE